MRMTKGSVPPVTAVPGPAHHRGDIQGLRAVAVVLVIVDHAGAEWLTGGFIGVDVFFVISGYLITRLLVREAMASGRISIGDFYARRARRILPAATLVIVVTMAYAAHQLALTRVQQLREDAMWSAFFAANVHFARLDTDYFARGREPSAFQHVWSLAVEEQFYLVWPLLLASVLVVVARAGGSAAARTRALTMVLVVVVLASSVWSLLQTHASPATAFYSSPARAWELAVGSLVAVQEARTARLGRWSRRWLGAAGLVAVAAAAVGYGPGSAFPGWRALLPVLGAAALVVAGSAGFTGPTRLLALPPLTWLGDISYSLYLWHWPILVLGPSHLVGLGAATSTAVLLGVTLLAAVTTYHLVENPLRRSRTLRRGRRSLVLWPAAVGLSLVSVVVAERQSAQLLAERIAGPSIEQGPASLSPPGEPTESGRPDRRDGRTGPSPAAPGPTLGQRVAEALRAADAESRVPFPLANLPEAPDEVFWRLGPDCVVDAAETSSRVCSVGARRSRRVVVALGDSQMGQWMPAIDELGRSEGFRVLPLVKFGCPPFDVPVVDGSGAHYWQCDEFRQWAADYIAERRPDLVIIGSEATSYRLRPAPGLTTSQTWASGVRRLVERMQRVGARVAVLADTPDLAFDPEECLTSPGSTLKSCVGRPHEGLLAANAVTRQTVVEAGAAYVDVVSLLCLRGRCPLVVDRTMTFMDYSHVSAAWATALADDLGRLYHRAVRQLGDEAPADPAW